MAYQPTIVVGDFFEELLMKAFGLVREDKEMRGKMPDLITKDNSFFVEVKASSFSNGGVIKEKQLYKFDKEVNIRRFYAFPYHSITRDMQILYPSKAKLRAALDLKSLYLFPFSIVKAHFENSKKIKHPQPDTYVQLTEMQARDIYDGIDYEWERLKLKTEDYKKCTLYPKVYLMTRAGALEKEIKDSFHKEFIK